MVRDAHERIDGAPNDVERAKALCEAAELLAPGSAKGLFLRAIRADPASSEVIERVVAGLGRRPRVLESILWRHLAASPWGETKGATKVTLGALASLYEGPLKNATRAMALRNAIDAVTSKEGPPGELEGSGRAPVGHP